MEPMQVVGTQVYIQVLCTDKACNLMIADNHLTAFWLDVKITANAQVPHRCAVGMSVSN